MYITAEELQKRLTRTEVQIKEKEKITHNRAKNEDGTERRLTLEEKTLAGILAQDTPVREVAEFLGTTKNVVSLAARGMDSIQTGVNKELRDGVDAGINRIKDNEEERREKIKDQLITNLAAAIGHVGNNLHQTDANEASKIAVDMSKILDRVSGSVRDSGGQRNTVIINVPTMRDEKHYTAIDV